jgi:crossover junction endodeoxyribonuclease RuvC
VIVLGIDPGTARMGYGIVRSEGSRLALVDHGCLETSAALTLPERLQRLHAGVTMLIELHRPAAIGVERLFFNRNAQTAFAVGQARGVVLLAAAQQGVQVVEYGPHEVKIAVTGYGRATKTQVQRMVALLLAMDELPRPDDAADALAVAVCAAHAAPIAAARPA